MRGVAGSGKSLILLYRLKLLKQFFPDQRFLVITHNRPLIRDLQAKFKKLNPGQADNIDWYTFMQLCGHLSKKREANGKTISIGERQRIFEDLWGSEFNRSALSPRLIGNEIDWFKDQTFLKPEDYLTFNRRGRGFRIQDRAVMLQTILKYDAILKAKKKMDWADIPLALWRDMEAQRTKPEPYDVIFIDEAQFFAPVWFAIIDHILKPNSGHLFVVADPTQGFLRKGASWKSLGLDARGKTHRLSKSYRTTMEILNFSSLLYRSRTSEKDDDIIFPDLENMPAGPLPLVIPVSKPQDEVRKAVEYVADMLSKHKIPPDQILVLHANWEGAEAVVRELVRVCGKDVAGDPKDRDPGGFVRVTTINAGTGIESRFVFLLGLNTLFEEEQSLRISDDERAALIGENSKKLYMAMTRAGQRLIITYAGEMPKALPPHRIRR